MCNTNKPALPACLSRGTERSVPADQRLWEQTPLGAAAALESCPHPSCLPRSTSGLLFFQQRDDNPPLPPPPTPSPLQQRQQQCGQRCHLSPPRAPFLQTANAGLQRVSSGALTAACVLAFVLLNADKLGRATVSQCRLCFNRKHIISAVIAC